MELNQYLKRISNNLVLHKIKGSALYFTIVVIFIISIISLLFLFISGFQNELNIKYQIQDKLQVNCKNAIQLRANNILTDGIYDLFGEETDSVEISSSNWGAFSVVKTKSFHRNQFEKRTALVGSILKPDYALYLADHNKKLAYKSATVIGNAYLPLKGYEQAYLKYRNATNSTFLNGTKKNALNKLPSLIQTSPFENYNNETPQTSFENDTVINSFFEPTKYVEIQNSIIKNSFYSGNIILFSEDSIVIQNNNSINNCLIISPKIIIENYTKIQAQIIASEQIICKAFSELQYPSSIWLNQKRVTQKQITIQIQDSSIVNGDIILTYEKNEKNFLPILKVEPKATVNGMIYNQGKLQLEGTVNGFCMTNYFYHESSSSSYENYFIGGKISSSNLPKNWFFSNVLEDAQKGIVTWLN